MKKKVIIGMSGGVDSSVAAYILKEQGFDVIGVTMKTWQDECLIDNKKDSCCGIDAINDARIVASKLDIPYYVLNFKEIFKTSVIDYFVDEYLNGATPNPCIACNRYVKWESLLQKSLALGADFIATGHYAKIITAKNNRLTLEKASNKDQTYALYNLTQFQLSKSLMPVGHYTKTEIREIATKIGLDIAQKKDSQEICFIPDNNYSKFIQLHSKQVLQKGKFVDVEGRVLGEHNGIYNYTIGQRKGLGVTFGKPMYVKKIIPSDNIIVLASDKELYERKIYVKDVNFMGLENLDDEIQALGKIRYNQDMSECTIKLIDKDVLECNFKTPQRAPANGQAAVFYKDNYILCGGIIIRDSKDV